MSLSSNVNDLAAAVRDKFNDTTSRMAVVGPTAPTPPAGVSVLWVDTSGGTYARLKIVIGD